MAVETLYATSHLSGTVTTPANALGAPDATWTTDTGATNWTSRFAMGDPTGSLANGTHTITVRARKISGQTGTPVINSIALYENGTSFATITSGSTNITTTSQDVAPTFDSSILAGRDLTNIEVEIVTTSAGGSPGARTPVQIDSITWSGDFTALNIISGVESVAISVADTSSVVITNQVSATDTAAITVSDSNTNNVITTTTAVIVNGDVEYTGASNQIVFGWNSTSSIDRGLGQGRSGTSAIRLRRSNINFPVNSVAYSNYFPVTVGNSYTANAWIMSEATVGVNLVWYDSSKTQVGTTAHAGTSSANVFTFVTMTATAPAGAVYAQVAPVGNNITGGAFSYIDDVTLSEEVTKSASDSADITITEARTPTILLTATDTAAISVAESRTQASTFSSTDSAAVTIAETTAQFLTIPATDTAAISVADQNTGITGQSTPVVGAESTAITVTETSSVLVTVSTTDTAAITIADTSAPFKQFGSTDGAAISVADVSVTALSVSATDTTAVSVAETTAGTNTVTATEFTAISVSDVSSVNSGTSPVGSESTSITITETTALFKTIPTTDTTAITVADASATSLTPSATDTTAISVADASAVANALSTTDTTAITIAETTAVFKQISATDTAAITIADATTGKNITTTDTTAITISDVSAVTKQIPTTDGAAISVSEVVVITTFLTLSVNDTAAISVSETTSKAVTAPAVTWEDVEVTSASPPQISVTDRQYAVTVTQAASDSITVTEVYA